MVIYVGNLSLVVTEDDLDRLFSSYGTVNEVSIVNDKISGLPSGFVEMSNADETNSAVRGLDGVELIGQTLSLRRRENDAHRRSESDRRTEKERRAEMPRRMPLDRRLYVDKIDHEDQRILDDRRLIPTRRSKNSRRSELSRRSDASRRA